MDSTSSSSALASSALEILINYPGVIVAVAALVYVAVRQMRTAAVDRASVKTREAVQMTREERAEALLKARQRQQEYIAEKTKADVEVREAKERAEAQEKIRKSEAYQARLRGQAPAAAAAATATAGAASTGGGRRLGTGEFVPGPPPAAPRRSGPPVELVRPGQLDRILRENPRVVVDCFADWCGPCKAIAPYVEQLAMQNPDVKFVKIDVDNNRADAASLSVSSMPTFVGFVRGREYRRFSGADNRRLLDLVAEVATARA